MPRLWDGELMRGSISLDDVRPYADLMGRECYLVICGECKGRSMQYDAGNRERADFSRPWLVHGTRERAARTLARHNALHH